MSDPSQPKQHPTTTALQIVERARLALAEEIQLELESKDPRSKHPIRSASHMATLLGAYEAACSGVMASAQLLMVDAQPRPNLTVVTPA